MLNLLIIATCCEENQKVGYKLQKHLNKQRQKFPHKATSGLI